MEIINLQKEVDHWLNMHRNDVLTGNIGVTVSGGPDSVALLELLINSTALSSTNIFVIHINHGLRGINSDNDEEFVEDLAAERGLNAVVRRLDVNAYCSYKKLSIEEGARILRYKAFKEIASEKKAMIALGHTADDNVETFLFNLMRGTGLKGLIGIPELRDCFIRPLLKIWKKDIIEYLKSRKIKWREDETNKESVYTRNMIRSGLIPHIEKNYSKSFKEHVIQTQNILQNAWIPLKQILLENTQDNLMYNDEYVVVWAEKILETNRFFWGEILKDIYHNFDLGFQDFNYKKVTGLMENLSVSKPGSSFNLKKQDHMTLWVEKTEGFILFSMISEDDYDYCYDLIESNGNLKLQGILGEMEFEFCNEVPLEKYIDNNENICYLFIPENSVIKVAPPQKGERLLPLGLNGSKKVFRYLLDKKVPSIFRSLLPILRINNEIAWVPGVGISEKYKLSDKSGRVLKCEWKAPLAEILRRMNQWRKN
ncbi:MAG: tRNA lysidine(34) synthetase TilS [Acidobacteria bacterium]|nr:tRNA lysidine(34) synthetase TilS [Acidobacteriota bacterium]